MSGIFISYRRADSAPYAGRIYDHLVAHFGENQVFMDIDDIDPGVDFVDTLDKAVGESAALLAIIGPQWLTVTNANGQRRLDDPHDFTRLEISNALKRKIRVIPVLVDGVTMPRSEDLPADLITLVRHNAIVITNERFKHDISKLIAALEEVVQPAAPRTFAQTVQRTWRNATGEIALNADQRNRLMLGILSLPVLVSLVMIFVMAQLVSSVETPIGSTVILTSTLLTLLTLISVWATWNWHRWGIYLLIAMFLITSVQDIVIDALYRVQYFGYENSELAYYVPLHITIAVFIGVVLSFTFWYAYNGKWKLFR